MIQSPDTHHQQKGAMRCGFLELLLSIEAELGKACGVSMEREGEEGWMNLTRVGGLSIEVARVGMKIDDSWGRSL